MRNWTIHTLIELIDKYIAKHWGDYEWDET